MKTQNNGTTGKNPTLPRSAAYRLLQMVWRHSQVAAGPSWDRLNHSMRAALYLAIQSGMHFNLGDFARFADEFGSGYWLHNDVGNMTGEMAYRSALVYDNLSAARSFEAWKQRPPFIVDQILGTAESCGDGHFHAHASGRLALGFRFAWQGLMVTVTSFADDGQSITACTYKDRPKDRPYYPQRISRRFKITHEALKAEMLLRRKAKKKTVSAPPEDEAKEQD